MYIILFNVYCQTDCFLLKVYLLPPSLAVRPGSGGGLWCVADTLHRESRLGWAARTGLRPLGGAGWWSCPFLPVSGRCPFLPAARLAASRRRCALRPPGGAAGGRRAGSGAAASRRASPRPGRWGAEWPPPPPSSAGTAPPPPPPWAGSPGKGSGDAAATAGLARAGARGYPGVAEPCGWRRGGNKGRRRAR